MIEDTSTLETPPLPAGSGGRVGVVCGERTTNAEASRGAAETNKIVATIARLFGSVSTWGFVDQGIVSVASFAAAAIVGRVCGSNELGVYSLAVSIFWLLAGIPNALVWMPYTARAPRMNDQRRRFYLGSVTAHLLTITAILALIVLAVGLLPIPGLAGSEWFLPMCLALVPFSLLMMLREHLRRVLLAHMNTTGLLRLDIPIATLQLAILGWLAWTQRLSATTALIGMAVACVWGALWIVGHRDQFLVRRRRVEMHWSYNLQFGKWLMVVSIAWLLGDASYRWLVGSFHGMAVLGQYAAAFTTVMFINPIMLTVQNLARSILSNDLAQGGHDALWEKAWQGTRLIAVGFGVLFLGLAFYGGQLVLLFFGDEFSGLGAIVASLCLGMYFHVVCSPVEAALTALQDGRAMLTASLLRLGMILLAGIPLIAMYGPVGVGFAMALGAISAGTYEWYLLSERYSDARS